MEYRGTTIAVLIIFSLLFVGAIVVVTSSEKDEEQATEKKPRRGLNESLPAGRPDVIDADADKRFIELPSGLKYRILRDKGEGDPEEVLVADGNGGAMTLIWDDSERMDSKAFFTLEEFGGRAFAP